MNNMFEYNPVDFSIIESVDLVDKTDKDFINWRNKIYNSNKKTKAQIRRQEEIKNYPVFFQILKELWLSDEYENIKIEKCCKNCVFVRIDKYNKNKLICWKQNEKLGFNRKPDVVSKKYYCDKIITKKKFHTKTQYIIHQLKKYKHLSPENWFKIVYTKVGFKYYLYDLKIEKKPNRNSSGCIGAKNKEYNFKQTLQNIEDINIYDKVFKIYQNNNRINFKIPDIIFEEKNIFSIIEYKAEIYYGNFQQILDYKKLWEIATTQPLQYLFWIVYKLERNSWNLDFINKSPDEIQIMDEQDFLNKYDSTGLDSWM